MADVWILLLVISPVSMCFICYTIAYIFHGRRTKCKSKRRLDGKTVLITGGSSGIGRAVAQNLAERGARVIIASRQRTKGEVAAKNISDATNNRDIVYHELNLSDSNSIREFAAHLYKTEQRLDILINNAAIAHHPSRNTTDGYEAIFGTNYIGHFLLTHLLLDLMKQSGGGRIVNVSSMSHTFVVNPIDFSVNEAKHGSVLYPHLEGYEKSKLAMVIHAKEIARRFSDDGIMANSCHPGFVLTQLWSSTEKSCGSLLFSIVKAVMWPLFVTPEDAANPIIHCAVCEEMDHVTGKFIKNCRPSRESRYAQDQELGKKLWEVSLFLTGITSGMSLQENLTKRIDPTLSRKTTEDLQWWEIPGVTVKESDPTEALLITRV